MPRAAPAPATASVKLPVIPPAVAAASAMSCGIICIFLCGVFLRRPQSCHGPDEKRVLVTFAFLVGSRKLDVNGAEEHEYGGLEEADENLQKVEGQRNGHRHDVTGP